MKPVQGYYALSAQSHLGPGVQSMPKQEVAGEMTRSTIWSHDLSLLHLSHSWEERGKHIRHFFFSLRIFIWMLY